MTTLQTHFPYCDGQCREPCWQCFQRVLAQVSRMMQRPVVVAVEDQEQT